MIFLRDEKYAREKRDEVDDSMTLVSFHFNRNVTAYQRYIEL